MIKYTIRQDGQIIGTMAAEDSNELLQALRKHASFIGDDGSRTVRLIPDDRNDANHYALTIHEGNGQPWAELEVSGTTDEISDGMFVGGKAVNVFRLICARSSLNSYAKHGLKMWGRGSSLTTVLAIASEATGNKYGRSRKGAAEAAADLEAAIQEARSQVL